MLHSTTLRLYTLKLFKLFGIRQFKATSSIDQHFVCHLGDSNGEMPFYNFHSGLAEIVLMGAWCRQVAEPLVLDIGGNIGFLATQLAQLLIDKQPRIFSFEPVPHTFQRLTCSVRLLHLEDYVYPVCCGIGDVSGLSRICYSEWDTMFAQISENERNSRVGDKIAWCNIMTLKQVVGALGQMPSLIKIDVEGYEVKVLKGAGDILLGQNAPAIIFEFNPQTLSESGCTVDELLGCLANYELYYVNDFEHQRLEFGTRLNNPHEIDWVCNLFAVPRNIFAQNCWREVYPIAKSSLASFESGQKKSAALTSESSCRR